MNKKDYIDLDDKINEALDRTFNSMNRAGVNNDLFERAERAYYDAKDSFRQGKRFVKKIYKDTAKYNKKQWKETRHEQRHQQKYEQREDSNKEAVAQYISKNPAGRIRGILYIVFGSIFSTGLGIASLILFLISATRFKLPFNIVAGLFGVSVIMTMRGVSLRKRIKRFKEYVKCLNGNTYCTIKEIADKTYQKEKFVVKDIKRMIENKMFLEGHIDDNKSYFMISNEVYDDYIKSQQSLKEREAEEEKRKKREAEEDAQNPQNKEIRKIINEGKEYIKQIKDANDAIPGEEISNKLYKLENIVTQIFDCIQKHPNKLTDVSKFLNHYLPITLKLVQSYEELDKQPVQGDNIIKAKNEIESTLDMINSAFEKLFDDLFEDVAMDISTDISVLHTLFNQEGLTEDDFHKKS